MLGVVIGVATVMTMAHDREGDPRPDRARRSRSPARRRSTSMKVVRRRRSIPTSCRRDVRIRPDLDERRRSASRSCRRSSTPAIWSQISARSSTAARARSRWSSYGADDGYTRDAGRRAGRTGRWFTQGRARTRRAGRRDARRDAGRVCSAASSRSANRCASAGVRVTVIGLYQDAGQHLRAAGPGDRRDRAVPVRAARVPHRQDERAVHRVKPRAGVTVADAEDAVTVALREMRQLRPGEPNNFDLLTQDQILRRLQRPSAASSSS